MARRRVVRRIAGCLLLLVAAALLCSVVLTWRRGLEIRWRRCTDPAANWVDDIWELQLRRGWLAAHRRGPSLLDSLEPGSPFLTEGTGLFVEQRGDVRTMNRWQWASLGRAPDEPDYRFSFVVSLWPAVALSAGIGVWMLARGSRRRQRGHCSGCGHELLVWQQTCPECGADR